MPAYPKLIRLITSFTSFGRGVMGDWLVHVLEDFGFFGNLVGCYRCSRWMFAWIDDGPIVFGGALLLANGYSSSG